MSTKELPNELKKFSVFQTNGKGIESWFSCSSEYAQSHDNLWGNILSIREKPLTKDNLNQLLRMRSEDTSISEGFFKYYWCAMPKSPYILPKINITNWDENQRLNEIKNLDQLYYGLYRIYIDGLLYQGNVGKYFKTWANKSYQDIEEYIKTKLVDTNRIKNRSALFPLDDIPQDNRFLVAEIMSNYYGDDKQLLKYLLEAWKIHKSRKGGRITINKLLSTYQDSVKENEKYKAMQGNLKFVANDAILEQEIDSKKDIESCYDSLYRTYKDTKHKALSNTFSYLSSIQDLDVYIAASMGKREDFRGAAKLYNDIFRSPRLANLNLLSFNPTISATRNHIDKGLLECLMVKCCKALIYFAGNKASYGKDAEAAIALSLGKPVIFLCDEEKKKNFYRDVHPLGRLIDISTGVAVGAMVTSNTGHVSKLLSRIFENKMEYELQQKKNSVGYLQLVEKLTKSIVRVQTNDTVLSDAFWANYAPVKLKN